MHISHSTLCTTCRFQRATIQVSTTPFGMYAVMAMIMYSVVSPVACVRFGEGTLATYVLQLVTFGLMLMLDNDTFILRGNRALANYWLSLFLETALYPCPKSICTIGWWARRQV